ncbi:hypothetical protein K501DRAFT_268327 [Backusella circina FSU 941]|nr:hypothetical protein K501DRAFT_268327 [Backusella circina FSU 941]
MGDILDAGKDHLLYLKSNSLLIKLKTELELEYQERHKNLKNSINDMVDNAREKGQEVADTLHDSLNKDQSMKNTPSNNTHYYIDQIYNSSASMSSNSNTSDGLNPDLAFRSTWADRSMMYSVEHDIEAMKSNTPEGFEPVAAKLDENFGINALID